MEVDERRSSKFPEREIPGYGQQSDDLTDYLGGIINEGEWGWMTNMYSNDATLLICSLSTGKYILRHVFWTEKAKSTQRCSISCVEELFPGQRDRMQLLAVCLETWSKTKSRPEDCKKAKTQIAILSTCYNQVIRYIDLGSLYCSTLTFMDPLICQRTRLCSFDGCLAVGTDEGVVLLCDIKHTNLIENRSQNIQLPQSEIVCGEIVRKESYECCMSNFHILVQEYGETNDHLAVVVNVGGIKVQCLIFVNFITGFAAGLTDGRIVIYDLDHFETTAVLCPPGDMLVSVERLCYVVPPDDPQPCLFIFGMYGGATETTILLHSVNYRDSFKDDECNQLYFKTFRSAEISFRLRLDGGNCSVFGCTTVSTLNFFGDMGTQLAVFSWYSHGMRRNKLLLFDMNQWYKDEMPNCLDMHERPNFLSSYALGDQAPGLSFYMNPRNILHFISMQCYDEHFYPNSLSFDVSLLTAGGCQYCVHEGLQHRFLRNLQHEKPTLFMFPEEIHREIERLRLQPQFSGLPSNATYSRTAIYEEILSVALEHSCMGLLRNCARSWIDGSYMCDLRDPTTISLLTLTDWIMKRAAEIKDRCLGLCQGIFDYGAYPLDEREHKELRVLNGQLGHLDELQSYIVSVANRSLAPSLLSDIKANERELHKAYAYQRVLHFFTEGTQQEQDNEYPGLQYHSALIQLRRVYADKRSPNRDNLYIDGLLRRISQESGEAAVLLAYPPDTLHSIMDLNTDVDQKHEVILYLLCDLDAVQMTDTKLSDRFKFTFRLRSQLVTRVKSLWALDHGDHTECLNLLSSSSFGDNPYLKWHVELLVETLMAKGAISDAMGVVYRPPGPLSTMTRMKVLMASKNIPEAFDYARRNDDDETGQPLLEYFFRQSIEMGQFRALGRLHLHDREQELVLRLLRECKTPVTDSVHLILLLQKSKYIESVSFMDEVAAEREIVDEPGRDIISAYRSTMNPVSQTIAGDYFRIRQNLDVEPAENIHPKPFSCQLAKDYAKGLKTPFLQSCALSTHWATIYRRTDSSPQGKAIPCHQVPFLGTSLYGPSQLPRRRRTVRPVPHRAVEKRVREQEESEQFGDRGGSDADSHRTLHPAKRIRMLTDQLVEGVCESVEEKLRSKTGQYPTDAEQQAQASRPEIRQRASILKRRPALEAVAGTPPVATSTSMTDAQRFPFTPPTPLPCHGLNTADAIAEVAEEEEEEETDEIIVEIESAGENFQLSVSNSIQSDEDEDVFMSPLTSPHASVLSRRLTAAPEEQHETSARPLAPPAGPQPRSSLNQAGRSDGSSGFGSFASILTSGTASHEFVPTVCSSKMGTQSNFSSGTATAAATATSTSSVRICERTTICGEIEEGGSLPESDWYLSLPIRMQQQQQQQHEPQMLDTTLGMSTYDVTTGQEMPVAEVEEELQLEESEEMDGLEAEEEEDKDEEMLEEYLQEAREEAQLQARPSSFNRTYMGSSDDPPQDQRSTSPFLSLSSEMSNMSSPRTLPEAIQGADAMYSIVIESTGSITTSRSVTHTPTSFLPSDTNVSQNSSPRATRGTGGDGSPRGLYPANSLETVDDLDTTKGSLEEEEEDNEDDDCVIALDGTRVGGYVARPSQSGAPSSSAELFAFKDETQKENPFGDGPSLSVGATATDPSIVILDSSEDEAEIMAEVEAEVEAEARAKAEAEAEDSSKLKSTEVCGPEAESDSESEKGSWGPRSVSPSESESSSVSKSTANTDAAPAKTKLTVPLLPVIAEDSADDDEDEPSPVVQRVLRSRSIAPGQRMLRSNSCASGASSPSLLELTPKSRNATQHKSTPRAKRATSTIPQSQTEKEPRQPRGTSEPPVKSDSRKQGKTSARGGRRLQSGLSDQQLSAETTPTTEIIIRELRSRRIRTTSECEASPAGRTATPTPTQVESDTNVPPKKRGRSKAVKATESKSKE